MFQRFGTNTIARPVYNSNYTSLLLNFADRDWEFEYIESRPLEYNDNTYTNNLHFHAGVLRLPGDWYGLWFV